jgi:hypothetical protein
MVGETQRKEIEEVTRNEAMATGSVSGRHWWSGIRVSRGRLRRGTETRSTGGCGMRETRRRREAMSEYRQRRLLEN